MSGTQDHDQAQGTHATAPSHGTHAAPQGHDTHAAAQTHDAHEGPIKTPKQLAVAVFFAFIIPIAVLVLAANFVSSDVKPAAGSTGLDEQAVAARIQPVGVIDLKDASAPVALRTGEQVYQGQCAACHAAGAAGAPKFGDAEAWGPRIKTGVDALLHAALAGKNAMPPQGGGEFSDYEIARAVVYMANQGGAKFDEPKPPASAASAPDAAASQ
ncbi:c-type cytochrome [Roseateles amylovorans]|uniref:C-type cytochrome n=1 Tax=Roseateles amylovorans TaxID=2978473 RepID=A0ABY6B129_9BURK|nr:c-type cytochrome [Roseateles amylovorans]UXH78647.1 c-type cytochrome [Roseateles amylovorans]